MLVSQTMAGITATTYIRMMSHTTNVNIGVFFGIKGRIYTTSTACTSGSMGIGSAYEAIKFGKQTIMIAGGGEELCATQAAVFDTLYATSTRNDQPHTTPAPRSLGPTRQACCGPPRHSRSRHRRRRRARSRSEPNLDRSWRPRTLRSPLARDGPCPKDRAAMDPPDPR